MNTTEIAALIKRVRAGDEIAEYTLVETFSRAAFAMSYSILANAADAEEVAQDALLAAIEQIHTLRKPESFKSWLLAIVRNTSLDKQHSRPLIEPLPENTTAAVHDLNESISVTQALGSLEETYRLPLMLFYFDGYSAESIAETLSITTDAAYARLSRARKQLRTILDPSSSQEGCHAL